MADDVSAAHAVGTIAHWTRDYKAWRSLPSGSSVLDLRYEDVVDDLDGQAHFFPAIARADQIAAGFARAGCPRK